MSDFWSKQLGTNTGLARPSKALPPPPPLPTAPPEGYQPPPGYVLVPAAPGVAPVQQPQDGGPYVDAEGKVNVVDAAAHWKGTKRAQGDEDFDGNNRCPQCNSPRYFSRTNGLRSRVPCAPVCFDCGYNGLFEQSGSGTPLTQSEGPGHASRQTRTGGLGGQKGPHFLEPLAGRVS